MKVQAIVPRGYCKGVIRAINIAKNASNKDQPIYILGMIVHNQYIVNALEALGLHTIDVKGKTRLELLDEIDKGTIIITAHGASDDVFKTANQKGLKVIDATCLDVIKTHTLIKERLNEGYDILYIGKNGHPESEGAIGINPKRIHLITSKEDIDHLDVHKRYCMTNQTTMSLYDVYHLCNYAQEVLNSVVIEKETCTATKVRQEAVKAIDDDVDLVIIVGDPHSNNTKKLASIASENKHVLMIESIEQLEIQKLMNVHKVAVSSGASTPSYLTDQIIDFLIQFDPNNSNTYQMPEIDYSKILF